MRLGLELIRECKSRVSSLPGGESYRTDPRVVEVFLQIMADYGRLRSVLADMHQSGLLGAFMPEFGGLTCLMQFNSYHQYTVDEHTLIALDYLDKVWMKQDPGLPGMRGMLEHLQPGRERACFSLALLLHDAGKFMGSGHVARGALMIHPVAKRLALTEQEEDLIHYLVAEHVTLSDATRMRDIHDPALVQQLARAIRTEHRLDLLYSLTYCDARAVAEGVLTGWEQAILTELYEAVKYQIGLMTGTIAHTSRRRAVLHKLCSSGLSSEEAEAYLANMRGSYIYQIQPDDALAHQALFGQSMKKEWAFI